MKPGQPRFAGISLGKLQIIIFFLMLLTLLLLPQWGPVSSQNLKGLLLCHVATQHREDTVVSARAGSSLYLTLGCNTEDGSGQLCNAMATLASLRCTKQDRSCSRRGVGDAGSHPCITSLDLSHPGVQPIMGML